MGTSDLNIENALENARRELEREQNISPGLKSAIELLIVIVTLLSQRLGLNSKNSSKPPSSDPNRKKSSRSKGERKPGGQPGRKGTTLELFSEPDEVMEIAIDRRKLPKGSYRDGGFERRQVVDIDISRVVTEYRAQVLIDENGQHYVAEFPDKVGRAIQYGDSIKAHSVYLSQYQLLPYNRIADYFSDQLGIPLSEGSIFNFNVEAASLVESTGAESIIKQRLQEGTLIHADETGINIAGKGRWLHVASNGLWTWFSAHDKRGFDAMKAEGILPLFKGVLCHDHLKAYFLFTACLHSLCNAHHLRELERAWEQDKQQWAKNLQELLITINLAVKAAGGRLPEDEAKTFRQQYQAILSAGEDECPPPDERERKPGQRGRLKRSKARNLLERLQKYENDTLRFMETDYVPFTNNLGENDIRMTKVHQKISGCFRSMNGAVNFCKIRSYISSCRKQQVSASEALSSLFAGELPTIFAQWS